MVWCREGATKEIDFVGGTQNVGENTQALFKGRQDERQEG